MDQPLVTIAISCYNHQKYVAESILSALKQTYGNIELLVFDDGSKDNSVEVIEGLKSEHEFYFQAQENMGLAQTLNHAIQKARGKYFVPFGSDDIMMPDRIEKQVAFMESHPEHAMCGGNMVKIDDDGTVLKKQTFQSSGSQRFHDVLLNRPPGIPAPSMFFKTEIINEVGGFDPEIALEDLYIKLKITHAGYSIGVMNDLIAYYRVHETNTYKNMNYMTENVLKTYERFSDDSYYEQAKFHFLNGMLLRASKCDTALALKILKMIPLKHYNTKTFRALPKLLVSKNG